MGYRNPAYLAKVAATIDIVSGGRVEMGIGGGWYEHEWRAYGYGFPEIPQRLSKLREGVEIMHQAGRPARPPSTARTTRSTARSCARSRCRRRHPFWIAGGGEKVTLKIAAQYAPTRTSRAASRSSITERDPPRALRRADATSPRSRARRTSNTIVGATEAEAVDRLAPVKARLLPLVGEKRADTIEHDYLSSDGFGSVEQVAERLAGAPSTASAYAIHYFPESAYDRSGIELFERRGHRRAQLTQSGFGACSLARHAATSGASRRERAPYPSLRRHISA
jgi:alkanesulfonate monooxygenase SsuD/methylene tetrahydromethanopterin reductase-like flavin-dependent oxidoreductase (luciferase family)